MFWSWTIGQMSKMEKIIILSLVLSSFALQTQAQEVDSVNVGVVVSKDIVPYLSYVSIAAANVSGGIDHTSRYAGQLYAGLKFDLE